MAMASARGWDSPQGRSTGPGLPPDSARPARLTVMAMAWQSRRSRPPRARSPRGANAAPRFPCNPPSPRPADCLGLKRTVVVRAQESMAEGRASPGERQGRWDARGYRARTGGPDRRDTAMKKRNRAPPRRTPSWPSCACSPAVLLTVRGGPTLLLDSDRGTGKSPWRHAGPLQPKGVSPRSTRSSASASDPRATQGAATTRTVQVSHAVSMTWSCSARPRRGTRDEEAAPALAQPDLYAATRTRGHRRSRCGCFVHLRVRTA